MWAKHWGIEKRLAYFGAHDNMTNKTTPWKDFIEYINWWKGVYTEYN